MDRQRRALRGKVNGLGLVRRKLGGFTLVELLVALAVFLLALGSLFALFVSGTRTNRVLTQQSIALQEGEGIVQLIRYEVGLAGFRGTSGEREAFSETSPNPSLSPALPLECLSVDVSLCVQLDPSGSDTVTIRFFEVDGPVGGADVGEQWLTYRVADGALFRVDHLRVEVDQNGGTIQTYLAPQELIGGVRELRVVEFVSVDRVATPLEAGVNPAPNEIVGIRFRVEFEDRSVWTFLVGVSNSVTVRVV